MQKGPMFLGADRVARARGTELLPEDAKQSGTIGLLTMYPPHLTQAVYPRFVPRCVLY